MQIVYPPSDLLSWCRRIYGPDQRLLLTDYAYSVTIPALGAGERTIQNLQITQNADFVMLGLSLNRAAGIAAADGLLMLITDSSTGEQFSNERVPMGAVVDTEATDFPRSFPYPRWVAGNSSITFDVLAVDPVSDDYTLTVRGFLVRRLS